MITLYSVSPLFVLQTSSTDQVFNLFVKKTKGLKGNGDSSLILYKQGIVKWCLCMVMLLERVFVLFTRLFFLFSPHQVFIFFLLTIHCSSQKKYVCLNCENTQITFKNKNS